jgi:hypothetical protein
LFNIYPDVLAGQYTDIKIGDDSGENSVRIRIVQIFQIQIRGNDGGFVGFVPLVQQIQQFRSGKGICHFGSQIVDD